MRRRIHETAENTKQELFNTISEFLHIAGQGDWRDWDGVADGSDPQRAVSSIIDDNHEIVWVNDNFWEIRGGGHDPIGIFLEPAVDADAPACDWHISDDSDFAGEVYLDVDHPQFSMRHALECNALVMSDIIKEMENESWGGGYGNNMAAWKIAQGEHEYFDEDDWTIPHERVSSAFNARLDQIMIQMGL